MFKWHHSEVVSTNATAENVWRKWEDGNTWPEWDTELEWVELSSGIAEGSSGKMKPKGGPNVKFVITKSKRNSSFQDVAKLPLTILTFDHEYIPQGASDATAYIRHSVTMNGITAPLFGHVIGSKIKLHLRESMERLSRLAE